MSHVATIAVDIKDLDALEAAAKKLGLVLNRGQQTYRWYMRSVGDYPLPEGFTEEELGKCEHAISIPGDQNAYEIGVVKRKDGRPGFVLLWDFFAGGYGLQAKVGKDANLLRQRYAAEVAIKQAKRQGMRVTEKMEGDKIKLVCMR